MSAGETVPSVPLHGEFNLRLDVKNRLTLPADVRAQMAVTESTAFIARGNIKSLESVLWLFPDRRYDEIHAECDGAEDALGFDLQMFDLAVATRLNFDKRGRVTIPSRLLGHYGIFAPEVTLLGLGDHYELWSQSRWQEHTAKLHTSINAVSPQ